MKRSEGRKLKRLSVRLEVDEWAFLQRRAEESGMVLSDFVRFRMGVSDAKENKKEYWGKNKKNTGKKKKKKTKKNIGR